MDFGRLAGSDQINARIYACLGRLHSSDVNNFVRKFRQDSDAQRFHTYRELLFGAYAIECGWNLRYEHRVGGKTPDWVLRTANSVVTEIVDVVTLHQRYDIDADISRGLGMNGIWTGWITVPPEHVFSKIEAKATQYSSLVKELGVPYVVAVFGEFTASINLLDVEHVLYDFHGGLFRNRPTLAGVILFREKRGAYEFTYYPNRDAIHPSAIAARPRGTTAEWAGPPT